MRIIIAEIIDNVIWMQLNDDDDNPVFKAPLAQAIRDWIEPEYQAALAEDTGFQPEVAIKKVKLQTAFSKELARA